MTEHLDENKLDHNYDGIEELDNPLPLWWVRLFYITAIFGVLYCLYYWVGPGLSLMDSYKKETATANAPGSSEKATAVLSEEKLKDPHVIAAGKAIFDSKCSSCHGPQGGGLIGPNLTDDYWIHGKGTPADVLKVISDGVPDKGMLTWKTQLKEEELHQVTAYVLSLKGTSPANPKAPQGDKVE